MRRLAGGLVVAAGVLLLAEGGARLVPVPAAGASWSVPGDAKSGDILLNGNPWLLWELRVGDRVEQGVPLSVNALGLRDRERGPKARPRAAALGDSSVYGFGVRDEEVFTAVLEARLDADFVNAAVPGYSTFQSLNLLDTRVMGLDPDLLLVANLWSDNNFDSFVDRELLASYAGWEASPLHRARLALEASALFRWLDWSLRVAPQAERARKVGWQLGDQDPRIGRRRVAIDDYAANLEAMVERMRARGGGVVFVMLANREDLRQRPGTPAWEPYRQVMRDTAWRYGAPLVSLPEVFVASGRSRDALFLDQMHPTALGHTLMADAVATALAEAGWPDRPLRVGRATEPRPDYDDRFEGSGAGQAAPPANGAGMRSVVARVVVPQHTRGVVVIDLARAGDDGRHPIASTVGDGTGDYQLQIPEVGAEVMVRVTLDVAGDGPDGADLSTWVGPLPVPASGPLVIDLSGVPFSHLEP